jgi:hypothetical protein
MGGIVLFYFIVIHYNGFYSFPVLPLTITTFMTEYRSTIGKIFEGGDQLSKFSFAMITFHVYPGGDRGTFTPRSLDILTGDIPASGFASLHNQGLFSLGFPSSGSPLTGGLFSQ